MPSRGDIIRSAKRKIGPARSGQFDAEAKHLSGPMGNRRRKGSAANFPSDGEKAAVRLRKLLAE